MREYARKELNRYYLRSLIIFVLQVISLKKIFFGLEEPLERGALWLVGITNFILLMILLVQAGLSLSREEQKKQTDSISSNRLYRMANQYKIILTLATVITAIVDTLVLLIRWEKLKNPLLVVTFAFIFLVCFSFILINHKKQKKERLQIKSGS